MVSRLAGDLLGPAEPEEQRKLKRGSRPSDIYLTGLLWPPKTQMSGEDDEALGTGSTSGGEGGTSGEEEAVSAISVEKPSVAGLSFCIMSKRRKPKIDVSISFGRYKVADPDENGMVPWTREPIEVSIQGLNPLKQRGMIKLSSFNKKADTAEIYVRAVEADDRLLITLSLVNVGPTEKAAKKLGDPDLSTFFQTSIRVTPDKNTFLVPKPDRTTNKLSADSVDAEVASNELLFRKSYTFAAGHVCSAGWGDVEVLDGIGPITKHVSTTWLPTSLVLDVDPLGHQRIKDVARRKEGIFSAQHLAFASVDEVRLSLDALCDGYEAWLLDKNDEATSLGPEFQAAARSNLKVCEDLLLRMKQATEEICSNLKLLAAFQLANHAMHLQHSWDPVKKTRPLEWRPFQLAFMLIAAPSAAIRDHEDRGIMDLLWFPTGGGKTEAYLGLIALTAFYRRMSEDERDRRGVAAVMRYTLRLLTTQQFSRASAMIMACEAIRNGNENDEKVSLLEGDEPFSIGLWVGNDASPNYTSDAKASLNGDTGVSSPKQLANCPCCQQRLVWKVHGNKDNINPFCETDTCTLHGILHVWTVDDDLYEACPTLVIGTIDKFAQIVRQKRTFNLFGGRHTSPPDLILQDELHLISGPLGTIAGVYETAIDLIFSRDGSNPKVIGSTATIKRATEQVRALFDRKTFQFPPPGIDQSDSGFAVTAAESLGRKYLGVTTAGRSAKFTLQAVCASLLQSASAIDGNDARDPYQTVLCYFNSLRELGGALVLMQDDVMNTISQYAANRNEDIRSVELTEELTSRRTQSEVLEMLDKMATRAGKAGCVDVVLATNMVSVGVDVSRLGLMVVNGQPKTTAEYIQSTSRVGRGSSNAGLVVTILNANKARDRSHFETFKGWHGALYRDVEATSVTPFASRARDRALHAALVAAVRHLAPGMLDKPDGIGGVRSQALELIDQM